MATRMIVTSQPDVACDVCGRRLLRGEQPDVFLASGRRRMVCELCSPRASAEGWLREAEQARTLSLSPARPRQGRNPLARWRRPRASSLDAAPGTPETGATQTVEEELAAETHEGLESAPDEPVTGTTPVFAGVPVESIAAGQDEIGDTEAPAEAAPIAAAQEKISEPEQSHEVEPGEEGSWRDAWMFVRE